MSHPLTKAEARRAVQHILERLATPITEIDRRQLAATAAYAIEQIDAIEELIRPRRAAKPPRPELERTLS